MQVCNSYQRVLYTSVCRLQKQARRFLSITRVSENYKPCLKVFASDLIESGGEHELHHFFQKGAKCPMKQSTEAAALTDGRGASKSIPACWIAVTWRVGARKEELHV